MFSQEKFFLQQTLQIQYSEDSENKVSSTKTEKYCQCDPLT